MKILVSTLLVLITLANIFECWLDEPSVGSAFAQDRVAFQAESDGFSRSGSEEQESGCGGPCGMHRCHLGHCVFLLVEADMSLGGALAFAIKGAERDSVYLDHFSSGVFRPPIS